MKKYARRCDVTGKGINKGYCFDDGTYRFKHKHDALDYAQEIGYKNLEEAYEDGAYYYTEWEVEEGENYYDSKGNEYTPDGTKFGKRN